MGPPEDLVLELQRRLDARFFIETGTFAGGTAAWAARHFAEVVTIEASPELHARACSRFSAVPGVRALLGDSRVRLAEVLAQLSGPAVLWLDAHWSGGDTAGAADECPLLGELAAINAVTADHAVLVDDARCFLAPPPRPHRPEQWPEMTEVVGLLAAGGQRFVTMLDDVLIAVPIAFRPQIRVFLQDHTTEAWRVETRGGRIRRWLRARL